MVALRKYCAVVEVSEMVIVVRLGKVCTKSPRIFRAVPTFRPRAEPIIMPRSTVAAITASQFTLTWVTTLADSPVNGFCERRRTDTR